MHRFRTAIRRTVPVSVYYSGTISLSLTFYRSSSNRVERLQETAHDHDLAPPRRWRCSRWPPRPPLYRLNAQPGASARDRLVVSPAWLAQHLNDRDLVILQVGRKETYDAGHIPGARFVNYDGGALAAPMDHSGKDPNHLMLEMPAPDALRTELAALGISDSSRIVVVPADDYWSPSTRIVLTLDYAGLPNVSWLDGGLKGWTDAGRTLSTAIPEP